MTIVHCLKILLIRRGDRCVPPTQMNRNVLWLSGVETTFHRRSIKLTGAVPRTQIKEKYKINNNGVV